MKRVVVVGGGFAGSYIAQKLQKKFDVTLIDTKDYFEYTPGIPRTIVDMESMRNLQVLHSKYLPDARIVIGKVREIREKEVLVGKEKIPFDYLAICSGAHYHHPFKQHSVLTVERAMQLRDHYNLLKKAKSVLIVGGGLVGIELAGEIINKYPQKKLIIAHAMDQLIERSPSKAKTYAYNYFKKRGVEIIFSEFVISSKGKNFFTDKGRRIKADMSFFCTGIEPNYDFMNKNFKKYINEKGYVTVEDTLQLKGKRNIFAVGDVNDLHIEKTARNSIDQAKVMCYNICALENKTNLKNYVPQPPALIISLGKEKGIFIWKQFTITGLFPAILKWVVEKKELLNYSRLLS